MHADAPTPESSDPDWSESKPLLDDAMLELEGDDRHALILRFFEGRDFAAVGRDLGVSADAARMRVTRGLEKLRALLRKRGISSSAVALEALLLRETVEAMPGPGEYGIAMRDLKSSLESYWRARGFTQPEPTHLPADLVQILLVGPFHQNRPAYDRMLRAMRGIDPAFRAPQP